MEIRWVPDGDRWGYEELLLLADEQRDMVERYLHRGEMFALYDRGKARSVCVVTDEGGGAYELKNLATRPEDQGQGYGHALVAFVKERLRGPGRTLSVGTGRNRRTLAFYRKCGFVPSHVVENFFTDHYDHPIYEDGAQLVDMIYLKQTLEGGAPMTEFVFGPYRLEVDVEATRAWYDRYGDDTGGCDCAYCRNFAAAAKTLPPEGEAFLEPLGLSLRRPGDIGEYGPRPGGRWYQPLWHIAGRLLEAGEGELSIAPGVTAGFAVDMGPFLRDFAEPCFQCWLSVTLPWVLEELPD